MVDFSYVYFPIRNLLKDLDIKVLKDPFRKFNYVVPLELIIERNPDKSFEGLFQIIRYIPPLVFIQVLQGCEGENFYDWIIDAIENQLLYGEYFTMVQIPPDEHEGKLAILNVFSGKLDIYIRSVNWDVFNNFKYLIANEVKKIKEKNPNALHLSFTHDVWFRLLWAQFQKSMLQQRNLDENEKKILKEMEAVIPKTMNPKRCRLLLLAIKASAKYFHEHNKEMGASESEECLEEASQLVYQLRNGREIGNYLYSLFNIKHAQYLEGLESGKKCEYNKTLLTRDAKIVMDVFKDHSVYNGIHLWMLLKLAKLQVGLNKTCKIVLEEVNLNPGKASEHLHCIEQNDMLKMTIRDCNKLTLKAVNSRIQHLSNNLTGATTCLEEAISIAKSQGIQKYVESLQYNKELCERTTYEV